MNTNEKNNFITNIWSFFTSVKLTVVILLCLAITSIIGTVIIQNQNPSYYIKVYGTFFYNLFFILDIFDMYHSWWFRMLMAGLCINIIACSIHRLSTGWKIIFPKTRNLKPDRIKAGSEVVEFEIKKSAKELSGLFSPVLSRKFGFTDTKITKDKTILLAEKNRWTRLGVYVVHLSVILLIAGGLIGSFFGFEGFVNLPEGEGTHRIQLKKNNQPYTLPFTIRCDDFHVSFYRNGAPKEFISRLTLIENDKEVIQKDIIVNDPLRYKGISIYQSSYGKMPSHNHSALNIEGKTIHLHYSSADSGMQYTKDLLMGESFELPEAQGTFLLKEHRHADTYMGQNIGDTLVGVLSKPEKEPIEIKLPLQYNNFDKMRRGAFVFTIANSHELMAHDDNETQKYYTGLQVSKDPGVWVVYTGFVLMIIGCYISFFMSHQQIVIEIEPKQQHSQVRLAGVANKNKIGMTLKLKQLSKTLIKKSSVG